MPPPLSPEHRDAPLLLEASPDQVCASDPRGVFCWGAGQVRAERLGDPVDLLALPEERVTARPELVVADNVTAVDTFAGVTCEVLAGQVRCSGASPPDLERLPAHAEDVAVGAGFVCALAAERASCVGAITLENEPATSIDAYGDRVCVTNDRGARCIKPFGAPVEFRGPPDLHGIAVGAAHICAVRGDTDGSLLCAGRNDEGQLGVRGQNRRVAFTAITSDAIIGRDIVQVAAGHAFTCTRTRDWSLYCFGANDAGQLGLGRRTSVAVPVETTLPAGPIAIGDAFTCSASPTAPLRCLGRPPELPAATYDRLAGAGGTLCGLRGERLQCAGTHSVEAAGVNDFTVTSAGVAYRQNARVTTVGFPSLPESDYRSGPFAFGRTVCAIGSASVCSGPDAERLQQALAAHPNASDAWLSGRGVCVVTPEQDEVVCSDGLQELTNEPIRALEAVGDQTCAITTAGEARCSGRSRNGQLGLGFSDFAPPAKVTLPGLVSSVSLGEQRACFLVGETVYCAGSDRLGTITGTRANLTSFVPLPR